MAKKILHLDLDAFFCAVEEKLNPLLKNMPFATGGTPEGRGVVTSCSYSARKFGIHSAMPIKQAIRLYPPLIIVQGNFDEYRKNSKSVMRLLHDLTPLVEQISIDEAFLDVTDLPHDLYRLAADIQMQVYSSLKLPASLGGATNKLVAKIATNIAKSSDTSGGYPMAIKIIPAGKEKEFLAPLSVKEMWGIGPKSAEYLNQLGIHTIGDILKVQSELMEKYFGKFARELIRRAQGIDSRDVGSCGSVKSVSNERTFFDDIKDEKLLLKNIKNLSEKVGKRLRASGLVGKTIRLKIRWKGFETHTRQLSLEQATSHDSIIYNTAKDLFFSIWEKGKQVRLIGVGVSNLGKKVQQLSFFDQTYVKEENLLLAIDKLRKRFGENAIYRGSEPNNNHY